MKKKIIFKVLVVLMCTVLLTSMTLNLDKIEAIEVKEPTLDLRTDYVTGRIGDTVQFNISGLDFKASESDYMSGYLLEFTTEYFYKSLELQSIEVPYIYGYDETGKRFDNVSAYFMGFTDLGRHYMGEPVNIAYGDTSFSHKFTRDDMLDTFDRNNGGAPSHSMWLLFEGGSTSQYFIDVSELNFMGDVVFTYKVVDGSQYFEDRGHTYFNPQLSYTLGSDNVKRTLSKYGSVYHENSISEITSNKTNALNPGDAIELDLSITNTAVNLRNNLSLYLKSSGLTPVHSERSNRVWTKYEDGWKLDIHDELGAKKLLEPGENISFKQQFTIDESFQGSRIEITPGLSPYQISDSIEYDTPIVLNLAKPTVIYHEVIYTDGVHNEDVFIDQSYTVELGAQTPSFVGTPVREGYTFTGWNPDVSNTVNADATYAAQWEKDSATESFTITYTDGSNNELYFKDVSYTALKDTETPFFSGNLKREGYTFVGWNPDFSGFVTGDVSYVAMWEKVEEPLQEFIVRYTDGSANEAYFNDEEYTVEKGQETPSFLGSLTREGYSFTRWNPDFSDIVNGDVTYVAVWEKIEAIVPVEPIQPEKPIEPGNPEVVLPSTGIMTSTSKAFLTVSLITFGLGIIVFRKLTKDKSAH